MDRLNTLFLAVITATLLVGLAYWIVTDRANARATSAAVDVMRVEAISARVRECYQWLGEWDHGDRIALRQRFGPSAEGMVEVCRPFAVLLQF